MAANRPAAAAARPAVPTGERKALQQSSEASSGSHCHSLTALDNYLGDAQCERDADGTAVALAAAVGLAALYYFIIIVIKHTMPIKA